MVVSDSRISSIYGLLLMRVNDNSHLFTLLYSTIEW